MSKIPKSRPTTRAFARSADADSALLRRVEGLIAQGALSKAARHLTSMGILDINDEQVQNALRLLHPNGSPCPGVPAGFQDYAVFSEEDDEKRERFKTILALVRSFDVASAPGPSGLRPDHLKDLLDDDASPGATDLLQSLETLMVHGLMGNIPEVARPYLCGARLTPLRKTQATPELDPFGNAVQTAPKVPAQVRPIASGECVRRLIGKFALQMPAVRVATKALQPLQVGVGVPGAAELVAMSLQSMVDGLHRMAPKGD